MPETIGSPSTTPGPQAAAQVGSKRLREDDDLLLGLDEHFEYYHEARGREFELEQGKIAALHSGSYALELLSSTYGSRVCCHNTVLKDDRLFLWYYDACGILRSDQYLSMIADFEKTAAVIVALASCTRERFGVLPTSVIKVSVSDTPSFPPRNLANTVVHIQDPVSEEQVQLILKDPIYTQYGLSGRRTFAYTATTSPQLSQGGLMARFTYQVNSARPDHAWISIAREAGVGHLPDVHMWRDLWKMSDGARRVFSEHQEASYEDRTLRMIVYSEYGSIKTLFSQRCELMPVMVDQMVNCEYLAVLNVLSLRHVD